MGDAQVAPINELVNWLHRFSRETLVHLRRECELENGSLSLLEPGIECGEAPQQNMRLRLRVVRATLREISTASGRLLESRVAARRRAARIALVSRVSACIAASTLLAVLTTATPPWSYGAAALTLLASLLGLVADYLSPPSDAVAIANAAGLKARAEDIAKRVAGATPDGSDAAEIIGMANELALAASREMPGA